MPSAPYYRHDDPTGSALNNVAAEPAEYDEMINSSRVFTYVPSFDASAGQPYYEQPNYQYGQPTYAPQGVQYPAPVYYANQPQATAPMTYQNPAYQPPYYPSSPYSSFCHFPGYKSNLLHQVAHAAPASTLMGYYYSQPPFYQAPPHPSYITYPTTAPHAQPGYYYPGQQYSYPCANPQGQTSNTQTILPDGTTLFVGKTKEQVMMENQVIAENTGANKPTQMAPYKAAPGQQFWCRELDGNWSLRTLRETMEDCQPGRWETSEHGYPIFIRLGP